MMAKYWWTVLLLLLISEGVPALAREDFARGMAIEYEPGSPIYRLQMPAEVYEVAHFADLRDVRVFNSEGTAVPHAIRRRQTSTLKEDFATQLPLFPVYRDLSQSEITVSSTGSIVAIQRLDSTYVDPHAGIEHYIIDASHLESTISELRFDLSGIDSGFLGRARLEGSDDLSRWHSVVSDAALAIMNYAGQRLIRNEIIMPPHHYKYLRFTWLTAHDNVRIDAVSAVQTRTGSRQALNWTLLQGTQPDADRPVYEFTNEAQHPVQQIEVILPETNTLVDAIIRSRPDASVEHWSTRVSDSFYRLNWQGVEFSHDPVRVPLSHDRDWQVQVTTDNGLGNKPPALRVGWASSDVYFLARGEGPFTLAFGNANAGMPVKPVRALLEILDDQDRAELVDVATPGESVELQGRAALVADTTIPRERIVLWGTLVLGVLIIGLMTWRLFRQMNPR
jgi:hypothetical protein